MSKIDKWDIAFISSVYFGKSVEDVRGKSQKYKLLRPRQIAMYLCRELTEYSTVEIGLFFHRDHTTIIHGSRRMVEKALVNQDVSYDISQVRRGVMMLAERVDIPTNPFARKEYLADEVNAAHLMQKVAAYIAHERGKPVGHIMWGGRSIAKMREGGIGLDRRRKKPPMMPVALELNNA